MESEILALEKQIENSENASVKNNLLIKLCSKLYKSNPQKGIEICEEVIFLSKFEKEKFNFGNAKYLKGACYYLLSIYDLALENLLESLEFLNNIRKANALNHIANVYLSLEDFPSSLKYYLMALEEFNKINDPKGRATIYSNLGILYNNLRKYEDAIKYYQKAIKIFEENGMEAETANTFSHIGALFGEQKKYDEALTNFEKSLKIFKANKQENSIDVACLYISIGHIFKARKDLKNALKNYKISLKISKNAGYKYSECMSYHGISLAFYENNSFSKAINFQKKAIKIAELTKSKEAIRYFYKALSDIFAKSGDFKNALKSYEIYHKVENEIFNQNIDNKIRNLHFNFESEKRKLEIQSLENEKALKIKKLTNLALLYSQKNNLLNRISEEIKSPTPNIFSIKKALKKELNSNLNIFEESFYQINSNFAQKLKKKSKNLTPRQIQICALIKTKMSSQKIATLLNISLKGVEQQRTRIRKNLSLSQKQKLNTFILSL